MQYWRRAQLYEDIHLHTERKPKEKTVLFLLKH
jgi:hypothetical protein